MSSCFDVEVDLLVIGFGAAGAAAAITASEAGASVMIAEKQSEHEHTPNTRMSRGLVMGVNDVERGTDYLVTCAGGMVPASVLRVFAERANHVIDWLGEHCPDVPYTRVTGAEHPEFAGAEAIDAYQAGRASRKRDPEALVGQHLYASLKRAVEKTKTQIAWSMPAKRLLRNDGGDVVGALLGGPEAPCRVSARYGVVLACGGFEYDEESKQTYLPAGPMYFYGNPGNTGDGLRLAQDVGASFWHMGQIVGRAIGNFTLDSGLAVGFQLGLDSAALGFAQDPAGFFITDRLGNRFANESVQAMLMHNFYYDLLQFDSARGIYPRIPCYWFFDERRRCAGPISSPVVGACAVGLYDWSLDNMREIERGWIAKGNTPAEVAAAAGMDDPDALAATFTAYNKACAAGRDPLGRQETSLIPLDSPPYYCVRLWPGGSNTTGGPRRNERCQILGAFGAPIRGLYGAGELGQISGLLYAADGANLSEALCTGQIAAEAALSSHNN